MKRLQLTIAHTLIFLSLAIAPSSAQREIVQVPENQVWKRSQIVPVPSYVDGVRDFSFDASDGWMMLNEPKGDIAALLSTDEDWQPMVKQLTNKGVRVPQYQRRLFKRNCVFPESFQGQRVIIRFEGVAHAAKLFVNGQLVRDHWGSFSAWTADITDYIKEGKALVGVYTDERYNGLAAYTNGCAYEPLYISGIQYGVRFYAVPQNYIVRANPDVFFDAAYKDARLRINLHVAQNNKTTGNTIEVRVKAPDGKLLKVHPSTYALPNNLGDFYIEPTVVNPVKWDAEHPELCTLEVSLFSGGKKTETVSRQMGFRQVELRGRNLFVNGQEVKFRGIWGGNDAKQLRDLNINHVRKNWPTQGFLDSCDMFGVYVLDEIPATFTRGNTSTDPAFAAQWLELMADMVERDYTHPSVVMWSHGNESSPGSTTLKVHQFIKAEDPQRPDMFSWAQDVLVSEKLPFDIYSFHYPDVMKGPKQLTAYESSVFNSESQMVKRVPQPVMPVISDEFAHVAIGGASNRDPNIRNFWGESIKLFWDYMYNTDGSLGGNQFGVYTSLESRVNAPEEWLLRKAYSPVRIEDEYLSMPKDGKLSFKVQNRFCHTNLSEIRLRWKMGARNGVITCPDISPAKYGVITLPAESVKRGDLVELAFERKDGFQVDEYALTVGSDPFVMPVFEGTVPTVKEQEQAYVISGDKFHLEISKQSGQITSGVYDGKKIITGGPVLNIAGSKEPFPAWSCTSVSCTTSDRLAIVHISGSYGTCKATFTLSIDSKGMMVTEYAVTGFNIEPLPVYDVPWNRQYYGGFSEIGVRFELTSDIDRLTWDRKALWTVYPERHIGAPRGTAYKTMPENPNDWGTMTSDRGTYQSFRPTNQQYTNNFRATKEYIRTATVFAGATSWGLQVFSPMTDAVRVQASPGGNSNMELVINNRWNYPSLGLGNYMKKPIYPFENRFNGVVRMRFVAE